MPTEEYYSGSSADIFVYVNPRGEALVPDFVESLEASELKKVIQLIKRFGDIGEIRNEEKFRLEEKPIYALKSFQVRILCFFLPNQAKRTLVLTHGFKKKSPKMPKPELERAKRIYDEVVSTHSH